MMMGHLPFSTVSVATYAGPGDISGYSGAYAYWGFRAYNAAYAATTGALADLKRDDAATMTLNCLTTGGHDAATLATWMSGHTAVVTKLYDQSGNSRHLFPLIGQEASLILSGVGLGSIPCLRFDAGATNTPGYYSASAATVLAQPFTVSAIVRFNTFAAGDGVFSDGTFGIQYWQNGAGTVAQYAGSASNTYTGVTDGQFSSTQLVYNGASSSGNFANAGTNPTGTPTTAATNPGTNGLANTNKLTIGAMTDSPSNTLNGYWFETFVVGSAVSAPNQASQVANQRAYGGF